jgi:uncharacterized protein (TIGR02145 family)
MELTFTADYNGQYIPLYSIFIENLTQGGDTTLYEPDTVLSISYQQGIENWMTAENSFFVSQNYPNPIEGQATVDVYMPEKNMLKLSVFDMLGRNAACFEQVLGRGQHRFTFYPGNEKCYVLSATCRYGTRTVRMTSLASRHDNPSRIVYDGVNNGGNYKSQQEKGGFTFSLGDVLQYTGNSEMGQLTLTDSPTGDETYVFQFASGLPCPGIPTVTHYGQVYNTVQLGTQCWLKENLNAGSMISSGFNQTNNSIIEKYCYNDNPLNCTTYGGLYQWDEMMQYTALQGVQGICPAGWHIPTDTEWTTLSDYLGGAAVAGGKMKEAGYAHWSAPNTGATNEGGFTALPGGWLYGTDGFKNITLNGYFMSSTEWAQNVNDYWVRSVSYDSEGFDRWITGKTLGLSVRCLKD